MHVVALDRNNDARATIFSHENPGRVDIQAPVEGDGYGADGDGNTDRVYLGCFDKPARSPFFELTAVEHLTREVSTWLSICG